LLLTTVLAAVDIYARPSIIPLLAAAFFAGAALLGAVCAIRFLLVADDDGIWVRRLISVTLVEWSDVDYVALTTEHRSGMTVRINRRDGSHVDVPPSLLLPTVPTKIPTARAMVHGVANRLNALAAARR
jgi:hypothetical protein